MSEKHIITVSELKQICERAEKEFGPDALVRIQVRDEIGRLIEQDYCINTFTKAYDVLVLTNYIFEKEKIMERFVFPNERRAQAALDQMNQLINWYGVASRADMMDIHGTTPRLEDQKFGWTDLNNATIENAPANCEAVLVLPRALRLD